MTNILYLNTALEESIIAAIQDHKLLGVESWQSMGKLGEDLLPKIDILLDKNHLKLDQLNIIAVYPGPGSFTGSRIGVSCANTLAWSLDIPVISVEADFINNPDRLKIINGGFDKPISPKYSQPPSVTIKKK